jgi:hypothetical protein
MARPHRHIRPEGGVVLKPSLLIAILLAISPAVSAQDIVGLEDCAKANGADKKFGCLQANIEFLNGLIKKNDIAHQARWRDQAAKLAEANGRLDRMRSEIDRLKSALEQMEKKNAK